MRIAAWLSIACAVLSAVAVFMPAIELRIGGVAMSRRTSLSLYQASADRELARALLADYARAGGRRNVEGLADVMLKHAGGRAKKLHVDDARDAMSTLDDVQDSDLRTAGRALVALTWGYVALLVILVGLVFGDTMRGTYSRRRVIAAVALATLVAALAVGIRLGLGEAAFQANDELGTDSFGLAIGATLLPVGACGALAGAIALLVLHVRGSGAKRDAQAA